MIYPKDKKILNVAQVAEYYGVKRDTIYQWIARGRLHPTSTIGNKRGMVFTIESLKEQEKKYM